MQRAILTIAFLGLVVGSAWADTGTMTVSCGAGEYDVQVDGAVKGKCGDPIALSAGSHKVRVTMRGNQGEKVFQQQVAIEAGKTLAVTAEFRLASELDDTIGSPNFPPQKTLNEMQAIDRKIKQVREHFRTNLKNEINRILDEKNPHYLKLAGERKDEFETEAEFNARVTKAKADLDKQQSDEVIAAQDRLEGEYNRRLEPMIEDLKRLYGQEFTIISDNLTVEIGNYNAENSTFPVAIRAKKPLEILMNGGGKTVTHPRKALSRAQLKLVKEGKAVQEPSNVFEQESPDMKYVIIDVNANISIPRDEAREFKKDFQDNKMQAQLKGGFITPEAFSVSEAIINNSAKYREYNLVKSKLTQLSHISLMITYSPYKPALIDLGNGIVYDMSTKLFWLQNASYFGSKMSKNQANELCTKLVYGNIFGWRLPSDHELLQIDRANHESGLKYFYNIINGENWKAYGRIISGYFTNITDKCVALREEEKHRIGDCGNFELSAWCVYGAGS